MEHKYSWKILLDHYRDTMMHDFISNIEDWEMPENSNCNYSSNCNSHSNMDVHEDQAFKARWKR